MAAKQDEFSTKQINPKLGGERGARRTPNGPTSSYDLVEQMEFLYVDVIKATHNSVNPRVPTCDPIVEITLGNYKSSTENLPIGPNMNWNQVFAFDRSEGDVLSVSLKDRNTNTEIGKRNFKLRIDIPTRVAPDARIAPQRYSMQNDWYQMELLMSIWFGTQADDAYPLAWFSDASEVSASCVMHTRPKIYLAPRLCYVRVTIVSARGLLPTDRTRTPSVYVKATLGQVALKTKAISGTDPIWNQDLIFVASEALEGTVEGTVYISLIDQIDEHHEECIGKLKKKVSEMKALITPGSAEALFYDVETPVKVEPAGDSRRFASRIKMKLATDQAYHVADECSEYASDYRAFAVKKPLVLGELEIGILGATGLRGRDEKKQGIDSYVVAKYGNKWVKTRTVVDNVSPKWNEQYTFDVYEKCTVLTLGVYDNRQIFNTNQAKDVPIGKVRIPLSRVGWDIIYTCSYPILILGSSGLKKMGELQLAIRCVQVAEIYKRYSAPFRWMLPKAHYISPLSVDQLKILRIQAVDMNCLNLAKTEPPLRSEVVSDMLKPKNKNFSIRVTKANYERLCKMVHMFWWCFKINEKIRTTTNLIPKIITCGVSGVFIFWGNLILSILDLLPVYLVILLIISAVILAVMIKFLMQKWSNFNGIITPPPPLMFIDLKLWKLEGVNLVQLADELAEEFDSFPSSETDIHILRMRYDRLRKIMEKVMLLMGDVARQGERVQALVTLVTSLNHPLSLISLMVLGYLMLYFVYWAWDHLIIVQKCFLWMFIIRWVKFPCLRNDLPYGFMNFFRRLPTNEEILF